MKSKVMLIVPILAMALVAAPAMATTTYFLNQENTGAAFQNPPPFGEVTVTLDGDHTAEITFTTLAPSPLSATHDLYTFTMKVGAVVNAPVTYDNNGAITSTDFLVSAIHAFSETGALPDGTVTWISTPNNGTQTFDGFGQFNLVLDVPNQGSAIDVDKITFTLTTIGTWSSDADVLTLNSDGYHVAAHEYSDLYPTIGGVSNTFLVTDDPVPLPPTMLLVGSALLGIVGLGWRRNRKS
jgi:hypothetical protein